jgi:hypothetical protein
MLTVEAQHIKRMQTSTRLQGNKQVYPIQLLSVVLEPKKLAEHSYILSYQSSSAGEDPKLQHKARQTPTYSAMEYTLTRCVGVNQGNTKPTLNSVTHMQKHCKGKAKNTSTTPRTTENNE